MHLGNLTAKCQNKSRFAVLKVLEASGTSEACIWFRQAIYYNKENGHSDCFQSSIPHVKRLLWCPATDLSAEQGAKMNRNYHKS